MRKDLLSPALAEMELKHLKKYIVVSDSTKHLEILCRSFSSKVRDLVYSGWIASPKQYQLTQREIDSWIPSHIALANLLEKAELPKTLVLFEYFFPLVRNDFVPFRADAVLCGENKDGRPNILGVEMKNWSTKKFIFHRSKNPKNITLQSRSTGNCEDKLMPHFKAEDYELRLKEMVKETTPEIAAEAIAYVPNISEKTKYTALIHNTNGDIEADQPANLYYGYDEERLVEKLRQNFSGGCGRNIAGIFKEARQKFMGMSSF